MAEYLYFFIYYQRNQEENASNIYFIEPEDKSEKPECYYSENEYNKKYNYKKVFKTKSYGKKKYKFSFIIGDDKYDISFDSHGNKFIYDVTLEYGLRIINVRRKIPQNKIEYKDKMDFFIKAIRDKEEKNKIEEIFDELYKNTIDLYSKKKGFHFLIPLFLEIYKKKKKLCKTLMKSFKETDEKSKINNMEKKNF